MRSRRHEAGRFLIIVLILAGLSSGVIYWRRVAAEPERLFQQGIEAYAVRAHPQAAEAWQKAVDLGHIEAHGRLAGLYLTGEGVARNHKRAFELYEIAAMEGGPKSQLALARLYDKGRGVSPDPEQALLWYQAAARNEDAEAQLALGRIYEEGRGVETNLIEAAKWYLLAADMGLGEAQYAIGVLHQESVEKNLPEAVRWLTAAAEGADIPDAWYRIARAHELGEGVQQDVSQAVWYYEQASKQRHVESKYRIGRLLEAGRGVDHDIERAVAKYYEAAELGHADAQYRLARAYETGEGAPRKSREAEKWYGKAAENGHGQAMGALQAMGLDREELSRYQRKRLEAARREAREKRETSHARKMGRIGTCDLGHVVEMRTRVDCLNRGGRFTESAGATQGGFTTVDTERDWDDQRQELRRRQKEQKRARYRYEGYSSSRDTAEPPTGDYIVCNSRGTRDSSGRAHYRCSSAIPKTSATTTSWCREQGYDTRRNFKHKSSARSWRARNCF